MKAKAELSGFKDMACVQKVRRNLARILDLRILDMDLGQHTLSLVFDSPKAFERAKQELKRIGFPVVDCTFETPLKRMKTAKTKLQNDIVRNPRK